MTGLNFSQDVSDNIRQLVNLATRPPTDQERRVQVIRDFAKGAQNVLLTSRQQQYLDLDHNDLFPDSFGNVCALVLNVILDRLRVMPDGEGVVAADLSGPSRTMAETLADFWRLGNLNEIQNELYFYALRDAEVALFIEWDGETNRPRFTANEVYDGQSRTAGVRFFRSELDDEVVLFASKQWDVAIYDEDRQTVQSHYTRLNLYEPGRITRLWADQQASGSEANWELLTPEEVKRESGGLVTENPQALPIDLIPIVPFRNFRGLSELEDVLRLQRIVNKTLGDIDIAIDHHAFPSYTADEFTRPDSTGENTEYGINSVLVGKNMRRIEPPDLKKMWEGGVSSWLDLLSILKRWPLFLLNPRDHQAPSGIALRTAERPLIAQIQRKQFTFDKAWQQVFEVVKALHDANRRPVLGEEARAKLEWEDPATTDSDEIRKIQVETAKSAGLPEEWIWRNVYGLDDDDIEKMKTAKMAAADLSRREFPEEAQGIDEVTDNGEEESVGEGAGLDGSGVRGNEPGNGRAD